MNDYHVLADCYDRLMSTDYAARAAYMLALFARHGAHPTTLLDLACGSGSLTSELAMRGCDMIGVDLSEDMLAIAREKCPDALLLCQDMRSFDLYDVVDGAVSTLDSFNHLLSTADIVESLARLRLFIAPNGLLVFDVNTPYKHRHVLGNNTFVLEDDDVMCVWQNTLVDATCTVTMQLDFFFEQEDGRYERADDVVRERAYSKRTWERVLHEAGFELLGMYDDMTFDTATNTCERWVLVARNTRPADEYVSL